METNTDSVLNDPRWNAFNTQGFACSCGETHVGLFPIHLHHPLGWEGTDDYQPDDALTMNGNFLSVSFCVLGGKFFAIRMRLPFRMHGAEPSAFVHTVWASLDRDDFERFVDAYRTGNIDEKMRVRARLVNRVGGFPDTFNLMGSAFPQADRGPPLLLIHGIQTPEHTNHPLMVEQRNGINVDRMLELFAAYQHDMRNGIPRTN